MFTNADFEKYNPHRDPAWRFQRVKELAGSVTNAPLRATERDDRYVSAAKSFILEYRNTETKAAKRRLAYRNPGLYFAVQLYEQGVADPAINFILEARLLARQSYEDIARCLATHPNTIEWYERLFFNVSDRLNNTDYIVRTVIVPAFTRASALHQSDSFSTLIGDNLSAIHYKKLRSVSDVDVFYDGSLKLFGYFGQLYVLEPLLNNCHVGGTPASPTHAESWLEDYWSRALKRKNAQAMAKFNVHGGNIHHLFNTNAFLIAQAKALAGNTNPEAETEMQAIVTACAKTFALGGHAGPLAKKMAIADLRESGAEMRATDALSINPAAQDYSPSNDILKEFPAPPPAAPVQPGTASLK